MGFLTLFFVGSVYLINGLGMLGRVEPKSGAPINLLVGLMLVVAAIQIMLSVPNPTAPENIGILLAAAGDILFAFTFLYVSWLNAAGYPTSGLNWYCGWSAVVSVALALGQIVFVNDIREAILWAVWAVVFSGFFLVGGLGLKRIERATGRFVVVAGFTTCVLPGGALMIGSWYALPVWLVLVIEALPVAWYVVTAVSAAEFGNKSAGQRDDRSRIATARSLEKA